MTATSGAAPVSPRSRALRASSEAVIANSGLRASWATPPTSLPISESASRRCSASCSRNPDSRSSSSSQATMPTPVTISSSNSTSTSTFAATTRAPPRPAVTMPEEQRRLGRRAEEGEAEHPGAEDAPRDLGAQEEDGRRQVGRRRREGAGARAHERAPSARERRREGREDAQEAEGDQQTPPQPRELAVRRPAPGPEQHERGRPVREDDGDREHRRPQPGRGNPDRGRSTRGGPRPGATGRATSPERRHGAASAGTTRGSARGTPPRAPPARTPRSGPRAWLPRSAVGATAAGASYDGRPRPRRDHRPAGPAAFRAASRRRGR